MAHFVRIDDDGFVVDTIVVPNSEAPDPAPEASEPLGQAYIASLSIHEPRLAGNWLQTSYNGSFRGRFAGLGSRYLADADVFIAPQPYPSWTLNDGFEWVPPVPMPIDGSFHRWDEATLSWVKVTA